MIAFQQNAFQNNAFQIISQAIIRYKIQVKAELSSPGSSVNLGPA